MTSQSRSDWFTPPATLDHASWPPEYTSVFGWRQQQLRQMRRSPVVQTGAIEYYRTRPAEFICHWCDTYDPRVQTMKRRPMVLFRRQEEFLEFLHCLLVQEVDGLVEKCRDVGATWLCCAFSVWAWRFVPGVAIGWGSRKADMVDKIGVMDSIFEKMRMLIRSLPPEFLPAGFSTKDHMTYMRILNPENDSTIVGESGDEIGRGGRTSMYFKDESAHYERPELIEAALGDNTRVQVDISSVNGLGNVFHRRREAGLDWDGKNVVRDRANVFVFDYSDHPEKTEEWFRNRERKATDEGLLHKFKQEVCRDYAASITGTIIPLEWIRAAIDAHVKLDIDVGGSRFAGLDVSDGVRDGDRNALVQRRGILLESIEDWGDMDVGKTTRRAIRSVSTPTRIQYDCIGIGAGVKADYNRLVDEGIVPAGITLVAWSAGAAVLEPDQRLIAGDDQSPLNKDMFHNLKAQGWWQLRLRFERTYRRLYEGVQYPNDELISISSSIPKHYLRQLEKELAQVTRKEMTGSLKMVVDKTPEGTRSPNIGDATMMAFWPLPSFDYSLDAL